MKMNIRGLSYNDAKLRIAEIDSMDDVEFNDLINHWKINDIFNQKYVFSTYLLYFFAISISGAPHFARNSR